MRAFSAIFSLFALLVFSVYAEGMSEEDMDNLLCTEEESTRAEVLKCIALMPSAHFEVIKECDTRMAEMAEDEYEKILDIYCSEEDKGYEAVDECVTKIYEERAMDEGEHAKPVVECMNALIAQKL